MTECKLLKALVFEKEVFATKLDNVGCSGGQAKPLEKVYYCSFGCWGPSLLRQQPRVSLLQTDMAFGKKRWATAIGCPDHKMHWEEDVPPCSGLLCGRKCGLQDPFPDAPSQPK